MKTSNCECLRDYAIKEGWESIAGLNDECEIGYGSWCAGYGSVMIAKINYCPICGIEYSEEKE